MGLIKPGIERSALIAVSRRDCCTDQHPRCGKFISPARPDVVSADIAGACRARKEGRDDGNALFFTVAGYQTYAGVFLIASQSNRKQ
jgi:hypothetical protein